MKFFKNLILIALVTISPLCGTERFVSATLYGELGNQMSMVSTALALAWDTGATPVFPDLATRKDANIPINYREIFFRLKALPNRPVKWTNRRLTYLYTPIKPAKNIYLEPWGFDLKYFDHHREKLLKIFSPRKKQIEKIKTKYPQLFDKNILTVGVHIRLDNTHTLAFCGFDYFREAVSLFPDDSLLVVGSNRIKWVKAHVEELFGENKNVLFLEDNLHTTDLHILNMCKHNITSASTLSFWSAYLNPNRSKKVVAPSLWYTSGSELTKIGYPGKTKGHLYPKDWIILEVPVNRIGPNDLKEYTSTSVNS